MGHTCLPAASTSFLKVIIIHLEDKTPNRYFIDLTGRGNSADTLPDSQYHNGKKSGVVAPTKYVLFNKHLSRNLLFVFLFNST